MLLDEFHRKFLTVAGGMIYLASSLIHRRHGRSLLFTLLSHIQIFPSSLSFCRPTSDQTYKGSSLFSKSTLGHGREFKVELVDDESWKVSSALALSGGFPQMPIPSPKNEDHTKDGSFDFDGIEELRLRRKLFYKLDKGSLEDEECGISLFSRQKSKSKKKVRLLEDPDPPRENPVSKERKPLAAEGKIKRERILTFSQSTDPYHLPFCLDVFITKGSVRACVIHRATSKVVSVAHSISKDMKFDLKSRRDAAACAAVGSALAQRALSDDIHNVVFSPRKGEKIEGKIQIVLQSIMDGGVDVKVKIKQRKLLKGRGFPQPVIDLG